jgi:DNA-binding Lrp family transcriptional regulator
MDDIPLDPIDRRLLDLLQEDARRSLETLAAEVSLSAPAVQRRIRRLREAGVITGDAVLVDPAAVGLPMTFVVIVELERERADQVDAFRRKAAREPQVQQCYYVTGEGDFVLIALARDMDDFEALSRRLFFDDPNVRRFRTSVVMGKAERSLAVPAVRRER